MMPPTSIDGTDITGATIDGTDVQEITVDGQTVFSAVPAIPTGAVAHWKFDDDSNSSVAIDSVGSNNGTISGATYTTGLVGDNALNFSTDTDHVDIPDADFVENTDFTVAFFVNFDTLPSSSDIAFLFAPGYDGSTHPGHIIYDNNALTSQEGIAIRSFDGSSTDFVGTSQVLSTNQWIHVAVSLDNSTGSVNIYIDGVKEVSSEILSNLSSNADDYYIGAYFNGAGNVFEFGPDGQMDDVVVYDRVLSDSEITALFDRG